MIYKGHVFRVSKTVVSLPIHDDAGNRMPYVKAGMENYVHFGRVVKMGSQPPAKSFKTSYRWEGCKDDEAVVHATVIANDGWSRTNMMYGTDGRIYMMMDGRTYTAKI